MYLSSIRDIAKGVSTTTARFAWSRIQNVTIERIAIPVVYLTVYLTEKSESRKINS